MLFLMLLTQAGDHGCPCLTDGHLLMVQVEGLLRGVIAHMCDLLYLARVFLLPGLVLALERGPPPIIMAPAHWRATALGLRAKLCLVPLFPAVVAQWFVPLLLPRVDSLDTHPLLGGVPRLVHGHPVGGVVGLGSPQSASLCMAT